MCKIKKKKERKREREKRLVPLRYKADIMQKYKKEDKVALSQKKKKKREREKENYLLLGSSEQFSAL